MNKVILSGNLTKDVVLNGSGDRSVGRTTIACQRRYKNKEGVYEADFPNVVAFGASAEFMSNYFSKGDGIEIVGRIQTGSYKKDSGDTIYTTDVIVEEISFPKGSRASSNNEERQSSASSAPAKPAAKKGRTSSRKEPEGMPDDEDIAPPFDL